MQRNASDSAQAVSVMWQGQCGLDRNESGMTGRQKLFVLLTTLLGLAAVEIWALTALHGHQRWGGPVLGAAAVSALGVLASLTSGPTGRVAMASLAAMSGVIELLFCVAAVSSVSAIAIWLLPAPIAGHLFSEAWTTDLIVLTMLGLGLIVASRGWLKYSEQFQRAAQATVTAERARAQVAERDRQLARSELSLLRAQIEPHFLWNTLAHVQHLTRKSPREAEVMTGHLIRFLRGSVPTSRGDFSNLKGELESAEAYLELMKIRMGGRLSIHIELDPCISDALFPPLLVHTLVENAIKHGIEPKVGPASITVSAVRQECTSNLPQEQGRILVEVIDNGVGLMSTPPTKGTGLGLRNVRERLQLLYQTEASLSIGGAPGGGVVARIIAPLVRSPAHHDPS